MTLESGPPPWAWPWTWVTANADLFWSLDPPREAGHALGLFWSGAAAPLFLVPFGLASLALLGLSGRLVWGEWRRGDRRLGLAMAAFLALVWGGVGLQRPFGAHAMLLCAVALVAYAWRVRGRAPSLPVGFGAWVGAWPWALAAWMAGTSGAWDTSVYFVVPFLIGHSAALLVALRLWPGRATRPG